MRNCRVYKCQELALSVNNIKHDLARDINYLKDLAFLGLRVRLFFDLNIKELLGLLLLDLRFLLFQPGSRALEVLVLVNQEDKNLIFK